jgi:hypothetical protein
MRLESLYFDNDPLKAENDVKVTLATVTAISIMKLIEAALFKLIWIPFLYLLSSQPVAFARILS